MPTALASTMIMVTTSSGTSQVSYQAIRSLSGTWLTLPPPRNGPLQFISQIERTIIRTIASLLPTAVTAASNSRTTAVMIRILKFSISLRDCQAPISIRLGLVTVVVATCLSRDKVTTSSSLRTISMVTVSFGNLSLDHSSVETMFS